MHRSCKNKLLITQVGFYAIKMAMWLCRRGSFMGDENLIDFEKGILIVDDNEDVVFAYDRYLRLKGFKNIFTATTRERAISEIRKNIRQISVVVLDWVLDGQQDCREIVALLNQYKNKALHIIFMSTKVEIPKEFYTQFISPHFFASKFFTSKDASLLYAEIMQTLAHDDERKHSRQGVLFAA